MGKLPERVSVKKPEKQIDVVVYYKVYNSVANMVAYLYL